jgi:hypothetical protein
VAQHADVQEELRLELHAQTGDGRPGSCYEEYLCRDDTFLAACVLETSRLHPILRKRGSFLCRPSHGNSHLGIAFSNPESSPVDKTIDGCVIPKNVGSKIISTQRSRHW